jgi:hypothetical protein
MRIAGAANRKERKMIQIADNIKFLSVRFGSEVPSNSLTFVDMSISCVYKGLGRQWPRRPNGSAQDQQPQLSARPCRAGILSTPHRGTRRPSVEQKNNLNTSKPLLNNVKTDATAPLLLVSFGPRGSLSVRAM